MPILHQTIRPFSSITNTAQFNFEASEQLTLDTGITGALIEFEADTFFINVAVVFAFAEPIQNFINEGGFIEFAGQRISPLTEVTEEKLAAVTLALSEEEFLKIEQTFIADKSVKIGE